MNPDLVAEAYVAIGLATDPDTLKGIWRASAEFLDYEYSGTTLRQYILARKEEMGNE